MIASAKSVPKKKREVGEQDPFLAIGERPTGAEGPLWQDSRQRSGHGEHEEQERDDRLDKRIAG